MKITDSTGKDDYGWPEILGNISILEGKSIDMIDISRNNAGGFVITIKTEEGNLYTLDMRAYFEYPIYLKFKEQESVCKE